MSEDYTDHTKWVSETFAEEKLCECSKYSLEEITSICSDLLDAAKSEGFKGCHLKFKSNLQSYEDYPDDPSVKVVGYRPLNSNEKREQEKETLIRELALEKGITPYEARHLKSLMDKGIVK